MSTMGCFAASALVVLVSAVAATGSSQAFVPNGGIAMGPESGLWGDGASGPAGTSLGCRPGRRFALAVTLRNRSNAPVTLTRATGPSPAPAILDRVAVQLRLAPAAPRGDLLVSPLRSWSAAPATPVTIPPGRSAVVQSNFQMRDCGGLTPGRPLVVGGSLVLRYRTSGRASRQALDQHWFRARWPK